MSLHGERAPSMFSLADILCETFPSRAKFSAPTVVLLGVPRRNREAVAWCLDEYRIQFAPRWLGRQLARPVLGRLLTLLARQGRVLALAVWAKTPGRARRSLTAFLARRHLFLWRVAPHPLFPEHAFVLERQGIPFDVEGDSDLSCLLNRHDFAATAPLRIKAGHFLFFLDMLRHRLRSGTGIVLLIGARRDLPRLATLARREHPQAVLEHCTDCSWSVAPEVQHRLLGRADHVYTVDSFGGFAALVRGIPVTVLGRPFYAGWGLTDDRALQRNRLRALCLEELFCGVCLLYTRYTIAPGDASEGCLAVLLASLSMPLDKATPLPCATGLSGWKWPRSRRGLFHLLERRLSDATMPEGAAFPILCALAGRVRGSLWGDMFVALGDAGLSPGLLSQLARTLTGRPDVDGRQVTARRRIPPLRCKKVLALAQRAFARKHFTVARRLCWQLLYSGFVGPKVWYLLVAMDRLQFAFDSAHALGLLAAQAWPRWKRGLFFLMAGENALFAGRHMDAVLAFAAGCRYYARVPELAAPQYDVALDRAFGVLPWQKALLAARIALSHGNTLLQIRLLMVAERFQEADRRLRRQHGMVLRKRKYRLLEAELRLCQGDAARARDLLMAFPFGEETASAYELAIRTCLTLGDKVWGAALYHTIQSGAISVKPYWIWMLLCSLDRIEEAFREHLREEVHGTLEPYLGDRFLHAPLARATAPVGRLLVLSGCYPGDELRFSRLYPAIRRLARAEHLSLSCDPRMRNLLCRSFPDLEFLPTRRVGSLALLSEQEWRQFYALPDSACARYVDHAGWAEIGAVDAVTTVAHCLPDLFADMSVLDHMPNLVPDPDKVAYYQERLQRYNGEKLVGISWRSFQRRYDRNLNFFTIQEIEPLFLVPGIIFVNCQYDGCTPEELYVIEKKYAHKIIQFPELDQMNAIDDTAALYACLDMMISAPTYTCELAASVGIATRIVSKSPVPSTFARRGTMRHLFYENLEFVTGPDALEAVLAQLQMLSGGGQSATKRLTL